MRRKVGITLALLAAATAAPSCIRLHGPEGLRRELSREAGVRLERETGITLTRSAVWLARLAVNGDEDSISLDGVRRIEIGVYEVRGDRSPRGPLDALRPGGALADWESVVRIRDADEDVAVLVRRDDTRVREMLVVVAESDEWVLVRMKGRLERVIEDAMRAAFEEAGRPELYARSRAERGLDPVSPRREG